MPTKTVLVKPYNREVDGHSEHVKSYRRRIHYRHEDPNPEEPHEVMEEIHVKGHESESRTGKRERVKPYNYEREEERFGGGSKKLYNKVYKEYRAKGYSKKRAREIAGGTVGKVYREKEAGVR